MLAAEKPTSPLLVKKPPIEPVLTHHMLGAHPASWRTFKVVEKEPSAKEQDNSVSWNSCLVTQESVLTWIENALAEKTYPVTVTASERFPCDCRTVHFISHLTVSQVEVPLTSPLNKQLTILLKTKGTKVEEIHPPGLDVPVVDSPRARRRSSSFKLTLEEPSVPTQRDE